MGNTPRRGEPAVRPGGSGDGTAAATTRTLGRGLLFPGPQAPLSHFGVTLLRHSTTTALRYALYQLGLPLPDRPPVRIVGLRLLFDGRALAAALAQTAGGAEVAAAVADPGGEGRLPRGAARLGAAVRFHRARQAVTPPPRRPALPADLDAPPAALWTALRERLSRRASALNEAFLAELLAALARRRRRAGGTVVPPAMSREAARLLAGRPARLERLGPPDLLRPSWAEDPAALRTETGTEFRAEFGACPLFSFRRRGRFREAWREVLDELRPLFLALAGGAARRGLIERPEDAFFLPFDLGADLALPGRPAWLAPAVAANRREHERWTGEPDPTAPESEAGRELWPAAPLWPLE